MRTNKVFNRSGLSVFLILVLGILAYSNTFHVPFFYDDKTSIVDNPVIRHLGNFIFGSSGYLYNPRRFLSYLSFAVNYHFGGLHVWGYHLFNLIVHLGCALLVYALLRLTFRTPFFQLHPSTLNTQHSVFDLQPSTFIPLFAALLFVAHPVQTQAVTYIVQRMASLATFFYLLSLNLYILCRLRLADSAGRRGNSTAPSHTRSPVFLLMAGSVFAAVLAMRSKEIAFTLPIAVLLYEAFFFRGEWKRRLLYLAPLLLTLPIIPVSVLAAAGHSRRALSHVGAIARAGTDMSRLAYLETQFRVIVTYLRLLVLPVNQNLDYDYPIYKTFFTPPVFLSFLFLAALFALAVYLYLRSRQSFYSTLNPQSSTRSSALNDPLLRLVSFGILWFFLALSVESSLIPISDVIFEHRLYLPSVGAFTAAGVVFAMILNRVRKPGMARGLVAVAAGIVLVLTVATWQRNQVWGSALSLWQDVVAKSPQKARPYLSLGAALGKAGRMEEAIAALKKGIRLQPENPKPYVDLGAALASVGRREEAIKVLSQALKLRPDFPKALNNLGIVLHEAGRLDGSIAAFKKAIRLDPKNASAQYNLGRTYVTAGRLTEGVQALEQAIHLRPGYDNARVELAIALNREGRFRLASTVLRVEMPRLARRPDARLALGTSAYCLGDGTTANRQLADLWRLDPRFARELAFRMTRPCKPGPKSDSP